MKRQVQLRPKDEWEWSRQRVGGRVSQAEEMKQKSPRRQEPGFLPSVVHCGWMMVNEISGARDETGGVGKALVAQGL